MSQVSRAVDGARQAKDDAMEKASPFVEGFARFGYAAKGVVYCIVGVLAVMAAFGNGGDSSPGSRDALDVLLRQPFGKILLGLVGIGLAGYSLWQFIRAVEDPEHEGSDGKGMAKRAAFFISGIVHLGLVLYAWHLVLGSGSEGGDGTEGAVAKVMGWPAGKWLVVAAGLAVAGYGVGQLVKAWKGEVKKMLSMSEMDVEKHRAAVTVARAGVAARGVVFVIAGAFAVLAAWRSDPEEAKGVGEAIGWVQGLPMGWMLLGVIGVGLVAYGVFCLIKARYRRIEAS